MTTWNKNEATPANRRCVLDVTKASDGTWAPTGTSLTGKVFIRLGGTTWVAASGTVTNTGYAGHWVYEATQAETNVTASEVEVRVEDSTYYAQTIVAINAGAVDTAAIATAVDALLSTNHGAGSWGGSTASVIAAAVWTYVIEADKNNNPISAEQMQRIIASILAGKARGLGTADESYYSMKGDKVRVSGHVTETDRDPVLGDLS